ncbi:MAG: type II restriction endonuclease [Thermoplasmataceae archaeon]
MKKEDVLKICKRYRENTIPNSESIVEETFRELGYLNGGKTRGLSSIEAVKNFNAFLYKAFEQALPVLERYERLAYVEALKEIARKVGSSLDNRTPDEVLEILFDEVWWTMQSRAQSRFSRGGSDFQNIFQGLMKLCKFPFVTQVAKEGRVDLILPNEDFYKQNKSRSMVISMKRTLRERWREVVEELYNLRAPNVYLAVAENVGKISQQKLEQIKQYNIRILVWDEVKNANFPADSSVIGYTQFAKEEISTFIRFWP